MSTRYMRFVFCCLSVALYSSCRMFGAGSHVYCETVAVACPSDQVIQRLTERKASGRFEDVRSFPDGVRGEQWAMHDFYFYVPEHHLLLHLEVPLHTKRKTEIHLAGMKDFASDTEWIGFADVEPEQKKMVRAWVDRVVQRALACEAL